MAVTCQGVAGPQVPGADLPDQESTEVSAAQRAEFQRVAEVWVQAYNSGDTTTLASLYTPDARYVSGHVPGLVAEGRDRVIANFQKGIRLGGHVDAITVLSGNASCNLATLFCSYEANNAGQKAAGRNLLVVRRVAGKWLIVLHMTVV